jgi:hypothetical protein
MAQYALVTLGELKDQLTEKLGGNSTFWVSEEKKAAFNEALKVWQAMTGEFTTSFTIPGNGEPYQDVPRQIVITQRMLFNEVPLGLLSVWELDNAYGNWEAEVGTPLFWAPIGFNKVALYPTPVDGDIKFEGISEAPKLIGEGDNVPLGEEEMELLVAYAHYYCAFKEGSGEMEAAIPGMQKFVAGAVLKNSRLKASTWYRIYMGLPHDEDQRAPRKTGGIGRA